MTCPICKSETVTKYRPFCSRRCADLDFGRWVTGAYAIPSQEPPVDDADPDEIDPVPTRQRH